MKKAIIFTVFSFIFLNISFAQNYNWITPGKTYLKMYLADDGIYRISSTDFTNAGIVLNTVDPRTVKVFNKGNQLPVFFSGESDGTFDAPDYFDFYGVRNYGGVTQIYDQNNFPSYTTNEYFNAYSDTNIYWVEWGGSNGLRYTIPSFSATSDFSNQFFYDLLHLEKDKFYSQGENISGNDYRFLSTEKFKGEGWYWTSLSNTQTSIDTFSLPLLYSVPQTVTLKLFAYTTKRNTSLINEHAVQVKVNGNLLTTIYVNDINRIDTTLSFSSSLLSNSSVNNVSLYFTTVADPATGLISNLNIDYFDISYPKIMKFRNEKVSMNLGGVDTTSKKFSFSGYNSANPVNIYDVTNNLKITSVTNVLDTLKFTGKSNGNFLLVNNNITKKPIRIKQRSVPNLASASNGADYLLIYNNLYSSQAEQLRAYRQSHDNFRSVKAEIEDLYDIFNYGLEDPVAVKNFTKFAYDNWQTPKISYICLFGRGSLDPKKIMSSSVYDNQIPVYGYPPSDGYYANMNIGSFFYYDMVAIGRIPVYNSSEAQSVVDKIISYEAQSQGLWSKTYTYITGGGTTSEQNQHQSKSNSEISTYISSPSLSGEVHKIYRTDVSGTTTFNIKDSIVKDLDRGVGFVNFRGHAGSHDWEVAMSDPNTLNNGTKLPIILSLTCFTGENALADFRGFGERFLNLSNKGAIAFVGTTGWSYSQQGNDFGTHIVNSLKFDTTRRAGDLVKYANKKMSVDSFSFNVRHTINCYSLIGDPAVKLKIGERPEFSITNNDYKLSNDFPVINDQVVLRINPKNYGLFADSCKIRFQLKKDNQSYLVKDTVRKFFAQNDSIDFSFNIDSLGTYSIVVTLDIGNFYPLENKSDNSITISLPVKNTSYVPLKPVFGQAISSDSVEFVGINPQISYTGNAVKVLVQMDTSSAFNSPLKRTFINQNVSGVSTKFITDVPVKTNNKIYYWRTNSIINNDSSGWTKTQNFVYKNSGFTKAEIIEKDAPAPSSSQSISVFKNNYNQYSSSDFNNTVFDANGIRLYEFPATLFVRSYGSNAEEASYFNVGNQTVYIDGGLNTGLNMLKVKKLTGAIMDFKNVKMNTANSSDSVVTFLNTFDSTQYLMLLNASYSVGAVTLNSAAKTKLRSFGSKFCDSITLVGYFHTWSMIGYLGATHAQINEAYNSCNSLINGNPSCDHWTESVSSRNVTFRKTSGTVSSIVGPAQSWTDFSWDQTLNPNSNVLFDVYGIDNYNAQTLLLNNISTNSNTSLSSVSAFQYPKLRFVAKIGIDTLIGNISSLLNSVTVNYFPPSELVYDYNSLNLSSSYLFGDEFKFAYLYSNVGFYDLPGVITNVYKKSISSSNLILTDTSSSPVNTGVSKKYTNKFIVPVFRDSMKVFVEFKPKGQYNDNFNYNNILGFSLKTAHFDDLAEVKVYSDGQLLKGGEFVKQNPEIKIDISNTDLASSDSKSIGSVLTLRLNNNLVSENVSRNPNLLQRSNTKDNSGSSKNNNNDGSVVFHPELKKGKNTLSVTYMNSSNNPDSVQFDVIVSDELLVKDLYNFPNPMSSETNFMFEVGSSETVEKLKLKIYTVSGKLIKELDYPVVVGFNQFPWDGKDDDGDLVANGTYLFKLVAEGDLSKETKIQKLVILR